MSEVKKDLPEVKEDLRPDYTPSEVTIKEMMVTKNCNYEEALHILRNPTPEKEVESDIPGEEKED